MAGRDGRTVVEGAEGRARSLARTLFLFLFLFLTGMPHVTSAYWRRYWAGNGREEDVDEWAIMSIAKSGNYGSLWNTSFIRPRYSVFGGGARIHK